MEWIFIIVLGALVWFWLKGKTKASSPQTVQRTSEVPGERPGDAPVAPAPPDPAPPVEVAVKRTGGFAGMTKQWRAEPPADEASIWIDLIAQCPWDAPDSLAPGPARGESEDGRPPAGADRFTWWVQLGQEH